MMLSTSNLNDSLISKGLQNSRGEGALCPSVSNCTLDSRSVGENVTVSCQVKRVVSTTLNEHQVAHVLYLLSPGRSCSEGSFGLLILGVLLLAAGSLALLIVNVGLLLALLKGKHLRRLFIAIAIFMLLHLMRHLSVHLRGFIGIIV